MAAMTDDEFDTEDAFNTEDELDAARSKIATRLARLTLWKLRDMRRRWPRPRTTRLPAQARALKGLLREAHDAEVIPPQPAGKRRRAR